MSRSSGLVAHPHRLRSVSISCSQLEFLDVYDTIRKAPPAPPKYKAYAQQASAAKLPLQLLPVKGAELLPYAGKLAVAPSKPAGGEGRGEERREERSGAEGRGEERRGEERDGVERNGEERRGEEKRGEERRGGERYDAVSTVTPKGREAPAWVARHDAADISAFPTKVVCVPSKYGESSGTGALAPREILVTLSELRNGVLGGSSHSSTKTFDDARPDHIRDTTIGCVVYIVSVSPITMLHTRKGAVVRKRTVLVADATSSPIPLTLWNNELHFATEDVDATETVANKNVMIPGDIVLLVNVLQDGTDNGGFTGLKFRTRSISPFECLYRFHTKFEFPCKPHSIVAQFSKMEDGAFNERVQTVRLHVDMLYHQNLFKSQASSAEFALGDALRSQIPSQSVGVGASNAESFAREGALECTDVHELQDVTLVGVVRSVQQSSGHQSVYSNGFQVCRKWQVCIQDSKQDEVLCLVIWQYHDPRLIEDGAAQFRRLIQTFDVSRIRKSQIEVTHAFAQLKADGTMLYHTTPWTDAFPTVCPVSGQKRPRSSIMALTAATPPAVAAGSVRGRVRMLSFEPAGKVISGSFGLVPNCAVCLEGCMLASTLKALPHGTLQPGDFAHMIELICPRCTAPLDAKPGNFYRCTRCIILPKGTDTKEQAVWIYRPLPVLIDAGEVPCLAILSPTAVQSVLADIPAEAVADRLAQCGGHVESLNNQSLLCTLVRLIRAFVTGATLVHLRGSLKTWQRGPCTVIHADAIEFEGP